MRYFIRHDKNAKVEGPFTVEELTDAIRAGRIPTDALASSDLGDAITDLQVWRRCNWSPIAAIEDLRGEVPPLPEPPVGQPRVTVFTLGFCVLNSAIMSYLAFTLQHWFWRLNCAIMVLGTILIIVGYVRKRVIPSPAF